MIYILNMDYYLFSLKKLNLFLHINIYILLKVDLYYLFCVVGWLTDVCGAGCVIIWWVLVPYGLFNNYIPSTIEKPFGVSMTLMMYELLLALDCR